MIPITDSSLIERYNWGHKTLLYDLSTGVVYRILNDTPENVTVTVVRLKRLPALWYKFWFWFVNNWLRA